MAKQKLARESGRSFASGKAERIGGQSISFAGSEDGKEPVDTKGEKLAKPGYRRRHIKKKRLKVDLWGGGMKNF